MNVKKPADSNRHTFLTAAASIRIFQEKEKGNETVRPGETINMAEQVEFIRFQGYRKTWNRVTDDGIRAHEADIVDEFRKEGMG